MKIQVLPLSQGFVLQTPNSALSLLVRREPGDSHPQLHITSSKQIIPSANEESKALQESFFADALVGVVRGVTKGCFYLLVVDESAAVGDRDSFFAQSVEGVRAIPFPSQKESSADRVQIEYIESSLHNIPFLYFSHSHDLVRSVQDQEKSPNRAQARGSHFVWNWKFLEPLYESNVPTEWIHPIIQGLVAFKPQIRVMNLCFDFVLITRRATTHQGTRFNCRGLDDRGCAANFCETEQILLFRDSHKGLVSSFLQIRGSIPTWWRQECSLVPTGQRASLMPDWVSRGFALFTQHVQSQLARYGSEIVMVNLIDSKGKSGSSQDQARLGEAFKDHVDKWSSSRHSGSKGPIARLHWFDFHHETKPGWSKLSKLLKLVESEFSAVGFYMKSPNDARLRREQKGCFRVNCMDNLDRTNVAQSIFARKSALDQISVLSKLPDLQTDDVFNSGFPELEKAFKAAWADNADAVSLAYAGSMALKTDFTRTGKRGRFGLLQDGFNSLTRLFVNNFSDWYKQDEIDVLLRGEDEVHRALTNADLDRKRGLTPLKRRLGALALLSLGFFTPLGQNNQSVYLTMLVGVATLVLYGQSKERPKLFPRL